MRWVDFSEEEQLALVRCERVVVAGGVYLLCICFRIVRVNKPFFGGLHYCISRSERIKRRRKLAELELGGETPEDAIRRAGELLKGLR